MGHMNRLIEVDRTRARNLTALVVPTGTSTNFGNLVAVSGVWTATRGAAGNYFVRRTAAAATEVAEMRLGQATLLTTPDTADASVNEVARGPRINSFDLIYALTTEAANAIAPTFFTTSYLQGGTIPTTAARAVTGTATLAAAATLVKTNYVVTTPFVLTPELELYMSLSINDTTGGGAVFDLYGVNINFDLLL